MDPSTMNETIGCKTSASQSTWVSGGYVGGGSSERASVDTKTAPTPIGPSRPLHYIHSPKRNGWYQPTEMATEKSLPPCLDVRNPFVYSQKARNPP